jgi:(p)ppGpp synthase/HD superfamily hydrolase
MSHASRAEELARFHHEGQFRRDGVTPYIRHVEGVVANLAGEHDEVLAAAWLHDLLEDCPVTMLDLAEIGMPNTVMHAVMCLTRQEDQEYEDFIRQASGDPIAKKVKIADLKHNLSDTPTAAQQKRYTAALAYLGVPHP